MQISTVKHHLQATGNTYGNRTDVEAFSYMQQHRNKRPMLQDGYKQIYRSQYKCPFTIILIRLHSRLLISKRSAS